MIVSRAVSAGRAGAENARRIALSTSRFVRGALENDKLAELNVPKDWIVSITSNEGVPVRVDGLVLRARQALGVLATGFARIRAVSPDDRQAIEEVFDLTIVPVPIAPAVHGAAIGTSLAMQVAIEDFRASLTPDIDLSNFTIAHGAAIGTNLSRS